MAQRKPTQNTGGSDMAQYYWDTIEKYKAVAQELVRDIEIAGGIELQGGIYVPLGDPTWPDLATTYLNACKALGAQPLVRLEGEDY